MVANRVARNRLIVSDIKCMCEGQSSVKRNVKRNPEQSEARGCFDGETLREFWRWRIRRMCDLVIVIDDSCNCNLEINKTLLLTFKDEKGVSDLVFLVLTH